MRLLTNRTVGVPVYSQFAAGKLLPIIGWRWIRIPKNYHPSQRICVFQVLGDSLIEAAILNGDFAICRLGAELDFNGQLAAVLIGQCITVKYANIDRRGGVWLHGANKNYKERYYDPGEATVQGVVIRIEREPCINQEVLCKRL